MRPAVVLVGVVYEVAIDEVSDALAQRGRIQDAEGAARRISNIRGVIERPRTDSMIARRPRSCSSPPVVTCRTSGHFDDSFDSRRCRIMLT